MRLTNTLRQAFVLAAMNDVPKVDYHQQASELLQKEAIKRLPPKIQTIHADKDLRHFLKTFVVNVGGGWNGFSVAVYGSSNAALIDDLVKLGTPLYEAHKEQEDQRLALKQKLQAVAQSATTTQQLAQMLPEFEQYLPTKEAKSTLLPAVANVLSDFVKAGWPKDQKKVSKAKATAA